MPTSPLSDAACREALEALDRHRGNKSLAASELGLSRSTFRGRLDVANMRGLHLSEGIRTAASNAQLSYGEAKGGWIHNYDDEGKKVGTTRWSAPEADTESLIERLQGAFTDIPAAPAIIRPDTVRKRSVAFLPHSDWHLGSVASADHVGKDYNRKIAVERLKDGFSECHEAIPASETAIILNNGDMTHANDDRDVTFKSQHKLKVEGTHHDNLVLAVQSTAWMIDAALQKHGEVVYRANPGNHDPNTPSVLSIALTERYRNEPRVKICGDQRESWVWQRGKLFLCSHHGHGMKPQQYCLNIPARFPEMFGLSRHWFFITGHLHSFIDQTYGGIRHWQLPAVCAIDSHADGRGYADTGAMMAARFDTMDGLKNMHHVSL